MKLKSKKETRIVIDSEDFDRFVEKAYGGSFEFVAIHEANNNGNYNFSAPNMNTDFGEYAKIRSGNYPTYCIHGLFNCLVQDGHIKPGEYTISVSW